MVDIMWYSLLHERLCGWLLAGPTRCTRQMVASLFRPTCEVFFFVRVRLSRHPFGMDTLPCTHLINNYHTREFSMKTDIQIGLKHVRLQCVHVLTCVSSMGCGCDRFLQVCKVIRPGSVPTCFCVDRDPSTFPDSRSRKEVKTKQKNKHAQ